MLIFCFSSDIIVKESKRSVSVIDNEGRKLQEISFTTGTCVKLRFDYNQAGKGYVSTIFEIAAKGISIDSYSVDNNWVNK